MSDLRKVLVDIEGMNPGDLVQWNGENFAKFQPLDEWVELDLPTDFINLSDVLGPEAGAIPSFAVRLDGIGGVHVKGAIAANYEDLVMEPDGSGILLATFTEEYRPQTRAVFTSSLVAIAGATATGANPASAAMMVIPSTCQVNTDGRFVIQPTINMLAWDVQLGDVLEADDLCVMNINGHYDSLS